MVNEINKSSAATTGDGSEHGQLSGNIGPKYELHTNPTKEVTPVLLDERLAATQVRNAQQGGTGNCFEVPRNFAG